MSKRRGRKESTASCSNPPPSWKRRCGPAGSSGSDLSIELGAGAPQVSVVSAACDTGEFAHLLHGKSDAALHHALDSLKYAAAPLTLSERYPLHLLQDLPVEPDDQLLLSQYALQVGSRLWRTVGRACDVRFARAASLAEVGFASLLHLPQPFVEELAMDA